MSIFYKIIIALLLPVSFFVVLFCLLLLAYRIYFRKEFSSLPLDETQTYKKPNLIKTILIDLPKTFMRDLSQSNPNEFKLYGLHFIIGEQGCGKTITMNYLIRKYQYEYPKLLIKTNFDCSATKHRIHKFTDIDGSGNGIYGELDCISEIQTWFDCLQSKNFPTSALATVTQQRHVHRAIIADTQNFTRCAKQLREQTFSIYEPHTFFGCFTIVNHYKPVLDDDGHIISKNHIEWLWFIHDDDLRNMYDSYSNVDYGQTILADQKEYHGSNIPERTSDFVTDKKAVSFSARQKTHPSA